MEIESGVMNTVEEIEADMSLFGRCLNALICPECGSELVHMKLSWFSSELYECLQCGFKHKRNPGEEK